jgi:hypothetical protein
MLCIHGIHVVLRELRIDATMVGIFLAVDGPNVWGIFVQIGPSDPKFLAVGVDPLP